jgi:signal transduction histidine kinase
LSRKRESDTGLRRAAIDEARQLAAEVHDGIGQELAGISLMLTALRRLPQAQYPEVQKPLENISGLLVQAMVNCRRISEGFGGFLVRRQGLTAALQHFASQFDDEVRHSVEQKHTPDAYLVLPQSPTSRSDLEQQISPPCSSLFLLGLQKRMCRIQVFAL